MKIKIIIFILLILCILLQCASEKTYIPPSADSEKNENIIRPVNHKGLAGNFVFYISKENSEGDIWLYNRDSDSKWQITSINDKNIELISHSPSYNYLIYNTDNKNIIYDIENDEKTDYENPYYLEHPFPGFKDINWNGDKKFHFLWCTNKKTTNIFSAQFNNNEWSIKRTSFPDQYLYLYESSIYSLSLSPNKELLAFMAKDPVKTWYIYIWDLRLNIISRLISVRNISQLIWSENNQDIYYYENFFLYSINLNGAKNLVISLSQKVNQLITYPKYKYKFFYMTSSDDYYSFIYLKNIDYMGAGNFLFNAHNLKNIVLYRNSDLLYYDNSNNEIFYYNIVTTEIKKILDKAALNKLSDQ